MLPPQFGGGFGQPGLCAVVWQRVELDLPSTFAGGRAACCCCCCCCCCCRAACASWSWTAGSSVVSPVEAVLGSGGGCRPGGAVALMRSSHSTVAVPCSPAAPLSLRSTDSASDGDRQRPGALEASQWPPWTLCHQPSSRARASACANGVPTTRRCQQVGAHHWPEPRPPVLSFPFPQGSTRGWWRLQVEVPTPRPARGRVGRC